VVSGDDERDEQVGGVAAARADAATAFALSGEVMVGGTRNVDEYPSIVYRAQAFRQAGAAVDLSQTS
jgi:hypothetical protein